MMTPEKICAPLTVERSAEQGKVFIYDDHGEWVADAHSRKADDLIRIVNAHERLMTAALAAQAVLTQCANGKAERVDIDQALGIAIDALNLAKPDEVQS